MEDSGLGTGDRPLLLSDDPRLRDDVLRLAASVGAAPVVVGGDAVGDVRRAWPVAPLVLVGEDGAEALAGLRLPRRDGVLLVAVDGDDPAVWRRAVAAGAEQVVDPARDRDLLADLLGACSDGPPGAPVLCVVGGCGGAGASVLAAGLAATAAAGGRRVLLVDADPWGGGLDLVLGAEHEEGLRWGDLASTTGRVSAASLRELLPHVDGCAVLTWARGRAGEPVPAASVRAVLEAGQRGHDLVVVDVPRRFDAATEEAVLRATHPLVVVPAAVRAVAAATTLVSGLSRLATATRLVVRDPGRSGLAPSAVAESLGLPLLATVGHERRLAESLDQGLGPLGRRRGPLARACHEVLAALGIGPR